MFSHDAAQIVILLQRTNHTTNQDKKEKENLRSNLRGKESQLRDKENVLRDQEAKLRDLQSQVQRTENDSSNIQSKCDRMQEELERLREVNKELKEQVQEKDTEKSEVSTFEPHHEKTCLRGFQPRPTQTRLYNNRRLLEARNF